MLIIFLSLAASHAELRCAPACRSSYLSTSRVWSRLANLTASPRNAAWPVLACNLPSSVVAGRPPTRISYFLSAASSLGAVNSSSNRRPDLVCAACGLHLCRHLPHAACLMPSLDIVSMPFLQTSYSLNESQINLSTGETQLVRLETPGTSPDSDSDSTRLGTRLASRRHPSVVHPTSDPEIQSTKAETNKCHHRQL